MSESGSPAVSASRQSLAARLSHAQEPADAWGGALPAPTPEDNAGTVVTLPGAESEATDEEDEIEEYSGLAGVLKVIFCPCWVVLAHYKYVLRQDDPYEERMRKLVLSALIPGQALIFIPTLIDLGDLVSGNARAGNSKALITVCIWILFVWQTYKRECPEWSSLVGIVLTTCLVLMSDFFGQIEPESSKETTTWIATWTILVLIMDAALVMNCPKHFEIGLLAVGLFYVGMRSVEDCWRIGLYDMFDAPNRTDQFHLCPEEGGVCAKDCDFMQFSGVLLRTVIVLALDYYITRDFRNQAMSAIDMAEDVASAMVRFDLAEAEELIIKNPTAPPRLVTAFELLLENLHRYRPFLPDALFLIEYDDLLPPKNSRKGKKRHHKRHNQAKYEVCDDEVVPVGELCPSEVLQSPAARCSVASVSVASSRASSRASTVRSSNHGSVARSMASRASSMASKASNASSAASRSRASRSTRGGAARQIQVMQLGLTKKTVVLASVAVRPWDWVVQVPSQEAETAVAGWLESVWDSARNQKATILGVRGQAALLVWGSIMKIAVTPACIKAAACMDDVLKALSKCRFPGEARGRCGICVGSMQVGNVGSTTFREHALIGAAPFTARSLCAFAEFAKISEMCDRAVAQNVENEYDVRHIDRWHFPTDEEHVSTSGQKPVDVYEIQAKKEAAENDEWMYQLEAQEAAAAGQAAHFSGGCDELFQKKNGEAAASLFDMHLEEDSGDMPVRRLRDAAVAHARLYPGMPYARNVWRESFWQMFRAEPPVPPPPPGGAALPAASEDADTVTVSTLG
eukprot:Hpha_TRINITY_DN16193_c1_g7::TRINITY_DN16193_c1_g7_i3::g.3701::m.3701